MAFEFGDVVLVPFPFTDQRASKRRPAVIVSSVAYNVAKPDVILMAVTGQFRPSRSLGEITIDQWRVAGLLKPSAIKPVFATLEQSLIIRELGSLLLPTKPRSKERLPRQSGSWRAQNQNRN